MLRRLLCALFLSMTIPALGAEEMPVVLACGDLRASTIQARGDYAYATIQREVEGSWGSFLTILDISNPSAPAIELGSVQIWERPEASDVVLDYPWYYFAQSFGLMSADVTDPGQLECEGTLLGGSMLGHPVVLKDGDLLAGVAYDSGGYYLEVSSRDSGRGRVDGIGDYVVAVEPWDDVSLILASDLLSPAGSTSGWVLQHIQLEPAPEARILSSITIPDQTLAGFAVGPPYAYAVDLDGMVLEYDISNPATPTEVASVALLPSLRSYGRARLTVQDGYLVISAGPYGLYLVDVRDPAAPALLATSAASDTGDSASDFMDAVLAPPYVYAAAKMPIMLTGASQTAATEEQPDALQILRALSAFPDLPLDHWAQDAIWRCSHAGIVSGYDDGLYRPDAEVTRDQMAAYIARAHAGGNENVPPASGYPVPSFSDTADNWAYRYIEYAAEQAIVKGYADGYHPLEPVSRGQLAAYIARARGWVGDEPLNTAPQLFPDVPAGYWSGAAIAVCLEHGTVKGYADGTYQPEKVVTRDQMAVYVARAFDL